MGDGVVVGVSWLGWLGVVKGTGGVQIVDRGWVYGVEFVFCGLWLLSHRSEKVVDWSIVVGLGEVDRGEVNDDIAQSSETNRFVRWNTTYSHPKYQDADPDRTPETTSFRARTRSQSPIDHHPSPHTSAPRRSRLTHHQRASSSCTTIQRCAKTPALNNTDYLTTHCNSHSTSTSSTPLCSSANPQCPSSPSAP